MGEGFGWRPAHGEARLFRLAVPGQGPRHEVPLPGPLPARAQDGDRGRALSDVRALRLRVEPARVLDRHTAAHLRALPPRRSPAPQRGHRRGRLRRPGAAVPRDLRRRRDLRALAAPGLRHRPPHREAHRAEPEGARRAAGPPRHELVGERRQGLLPDRAGDRGPRGALHRGARPRGQDVRRPEARGPAGRRAPARAGRDPALAARSSLVDAARGGHGAGRREDAALRGQPRRPAPGRAGHVLPRSLPAHEDPAALRGMGSRPGRPRRAEGLARARPGELSPRLRGLLRAVPEARLAGHARPQPHRRARPRPGHVRLRQEQERVARHRRVLQLRDRGHARRGGHRPLRGHGRAGGLRHRVLAAGGGQAPAHAEGEGAGPPGHAGGRRGRGHRQGHLASALG